MRVCLSETPQFLGQSGPHNAQALQPQAVGAVWLPRISKRVCALAPLLGQLPPRPALDPGIQLHLHESPDHRGHTAHNSGHRLSLVAFAFAFFHCVSRINPAFFRKTHSQVPLGFYVPTKCHGVGSDLRPATPVLVGTQSITAPLLYFEPRSATCPSHMVPDPRRPRTARRRSALDPFTNPPFRSLHRSQYP